MRTPQELQATVSDETVKIQDRRLILQAQLRLEKAWAEAVGPEGAKHTRVAGLRHGVLEVTVGNAVLLQELAHYQKRRLLEQLRSRLSGTTLTDLRFRAGVIQGNDKE